MGSRLLGFAALLVAGCSNPDSDPGAAAGSNGLVVPDIETLNQGPEISPAQVRALVERDGAERTVDALDQRASDVEPSRFDSVLNGIASGEAEWLALVPLLRQGTDGGTLIGLKIALSQALPVNAAGVLALISPAIPAEDVCKSPAIEPSPEQDRAFHQQAIDAVEAVGAPSLGAARSACLARLRSARRA